MKIGLDRVSVGDRDHALAFNSELVFEPIAECPAMKALIAAPGNDGIPFTAFGVDDLDAEYARLEDLGVELTSEQADL